MDKRRFLVAGALGAAAPLRAASPPAGVRAGPGLLTVVGAIPSGRCTTPTASPSSGTGRSGSASPRARGRCTSSR